MSSDVDESVSLLLCQTHQQDRHSWVIDHITGLQGSHSFTDKKIQDFSGPHEKIFQDLFGAHECLNMKKNQHLRTIFRV